MSNEEQIKKLIIGKGYTLKEFAEYIGLPYNTILSILNNGSIRNTSIENAIRICEGLGLDIKQLQEMLNIEDIEHLPDLTEEELNLFKYYGKLNRRGKTAIREHARDLSELTRYKEKNSD
jgi:transcriptional regulator with XRE-family HTH domain